MPRHSAENSAQDHKLCFRLELTERQTTSVAAHMAVVVVWMESKREREADVNNKCLNWINQTDARTRRTALRSRRFPTLSRGGLRRGRTLERPSVRSWVSLSRLRHALYFDVMLWRQVECVFEYKTIRSGRLVDDKLYIDEENGGEDLGTNYDNLSQMCPALFIIEA